MFSEYDKSENESENKKNNPLGLSGLQWCWEESNCRHKDFQSFALPSELQHHHWDCKGSTIFEFCKYFFT